MFFEVGGVAKRRGRGLTIILAGGDVAKAFLVVCVWNGSSGTSTPTVKFNILPLDTRYTKAEERIIIL